MESDIGSGFHWRVVYGIGHWIRLSLESSIWNRTLDQAFTGESIWNRALDQAFIGHWIRLSLESSIWNRALDQAFTGE